MVLLGRSDSLVGYCGGIERTGASEAPTLRPPALGYWTSEIKRRLLNAIPQESFQSAEEAQIRRAKQCRGKLLVTVCVCKW